MIESKGHKITPIDGDLAVSRNAEIGRDADIHGKARVAGSLKIEGFLDAPHIKGAAKGLFNSVEELAKEYPNPRPGWFAIVLDATNKEKGILYKAENKGWVATTDEAKPYKFIQDSINVFASKGELEDLENKVNVNADDIYHLKHGMDFRQEDEVVELTLYQGVGNSSIPLALLPSASESLAGVMSAEDKRNLNNSTVKVITWNNDTDPSNMNDFVVAGVYDIKGERKRIDDNLPILNTGGGHSFNARLTVLDSSIAPEGQSDDICITQKLTLSNRVAGDGDVYIRTGRGANKQSITWETWGKLQQNIEVGEVTSLDNLIDNGIYSGVWTNGHLNNNPLTFVCVVINDYFIGTSPRRVSQFLYGLSKFNGSTVYQTRIWDDAYNKWSDWEIINKAEIDSLISTKVEELERAVNAKIETLIEGADPNTIDSIKDLINWVNTHGSTTNNIFTRLDNIQDKVDNNEADIEKIHREYVVLGSFDVQPEANQVEIDYSGADDTNAMFIPAATENLAGVMSAEDKILLENNTKKIGDKLSVSRVYENTTVDNSNRYLVNEERDFGKSVLFKGRNNTNATLVGRFYTGTSYQEENILSGKTRNIELISEGGFTKIQIYYLNGTSVTGTTDTELSYGTYKFAESLTDELALSLESNREYLETQYIGEQETLLNFADVSGQLNKSGITYSSTNGREIVVLQDDSNTIKKCELSIPIADYGLKVGDIVDVACDFLSNVNNNCRLLVVSRNGNTNTGSINRIDVSLERGVARAHLQYTIAEGSNRLFIELSRQQKQFEVNDVTITNLVITKNYSLNYNRTILASKTLDALNEQFNQLEQNVNQLGQEVNDKLAELEDKIGVIINPVSAISTRTFANAKYSTFENGELSITHTEEYTLKKLFPLEKLRLREGDIFKLHINQTGNCKSTMRLLKKDASGSTTPLTANTSYNGYYKETTVLSDSAYMEVVLYLTSAGTATYSDIYLLKSGDIAENIVFSNPLVCTLRDAITFNIPQLTIGGIEYISAKENPNAITDYVTSNRVCKAGFSSAKKIKDEVLDGSAIVKRLMACDGTYTYWGEQITDSDPQMVPIASYNVEQRFKLYRCKGADVDNLEVVAELNQPITGVIVYDDRILCCLAPASINSVYTNARIVSIISNIVTDKLVFPSIAYLPFQAWGAFKRYGDYIYMPCYGLKESTNYENAKGGDKVWLSKDRGETWEIIFDLADHTNVIPVELLPNIHIHGGCICEDTGRMYITHGDAQSGIFWSDDEGNSWNYRIGTEDKCGPKLQMCAIEAMNNNIICGTDMSPSGIMMIRDYYGIPRLDEGYQLTPNGVYSLSYVPSNILSLPSGLTLIPCGDWQGYDKTNKLLATYDGVRFFEIFDEGIPCDDKVYKMPRVLQYESGKFVFDFESIREGVRRYCIYKIQL